MSNDSKLIEQIERIGKEQKSDNTLMIILRDLHLRVIKLDVEVEKLKNKLNK